jgi:transposase
MKLKPSRYHAASSSRISADIADLDPRIPRRLPSSGIRSPGSMRFPASAGQRLRHPRRDRHGHDSLPHQRAPGLLARLAPGIRESAGKKKGKGSTGHGNAYLAAILGNAAAGAGKTDTFLGEQYRRIARRRGFKRAIVAVGRSSWSLPGICCLTPPPLPRPDTKPGPDRRAAATPERRKHNHVRQLEALGYTVTLSPPPEPCAKLPQRKSARPAVRLARTPRQRVHSADRARSSAALVLSVSSPG